MNKTSVLLAVSLALTVAGCGGSGDSGDSKAGSSGSNSTVEQAVKYAQCMRENGVTDFPDPDKNGKFVIAAGGPNKNSPQVQKAKQACKAQEPPGLKDSPAEVAKEQREWLKFAQCMRQNGIRDFPDPKDGKLLVPRDRINVNTPQFKNALKACRNVNGGGGSEHAG
jgi:hypothetical protein